MPTKEVITGFRRSRKQKGLEDLIRREKQSTRKQQKNYEPKTESAKSIGVKRS
jgi:hypothetical protein